MICLVRGASLDRTMAPTIRAYLWHLFLYRHLRTTPLDPFPILLSTQHCLGPFGLLLCRCSPLPSSTLNVPTINSYRRKRGNRWSVSRTTNMGSLAPQMIEMIPYSLHFSAPINFFSLKKVKRPMQLITCWCSDSPRYHDVLWAAFCRQFC